MSLNRKSLVSVSEYKAANYCHVSLKNFVKRVVYRDSSSQFWNASCAIRLVGSWAIYVRLFLFCPEPVTNGVKAFFSDGL